MEIIGGNQLLEKIFPHVVLTIGNFDGLHLGHQKIIELVLENSRRRKGTAVVYTFRPHPQVALRSAAQLPRLLTYDEKLQLLEKVGLDVAIEEPFTREFSNREPSQFFYEVLLKRLHSELIIVGHDFAFGNGRHGHLEALDRLCKASGVELIVVPPQRILGEVVSSSRIRQCLLQGQVDLAEKLLGRPFFYRGVVMKGAGRGRTLGFPTANLKLEDKLILPYGAYATFARVENELYSSVTNVGVRPTFHSGGVDLPALVETHFYDTSVQLYGAEIEVEFIARLRSEMKFENIEGLKRQITKDIQTAKEILERRRSLGV
jgi:riboflavin kinase/FMN adenylyltransferase